MSQQQHVQNEQEDKPSIAFATLGMFIIDDIYPPPDAHSQPPNLNVIGGAGTYSTMGARLFSPPPSSQTIGWIIDAGTDFPTPLLDTINSWQTSALIRPRNAPTTRGWNGYSGNEHRAFKYLTEKKRITAEDLTPQLLRSKSFHLICGPERCIEQVQGILSKKLLLTSTDPKPLFIWEPVPDLCIPSALPATREALKYIDVLSPNHEELAALFDTPHSTTALSRELVETQAQSLLDDIPGSKLSIVVRCGAQGCFVLSSNAKRWLPALHTDSGKVIDPTGGGNGFLGGLAIGMVRCERDVVEAARWGSVAASLCIEQVGMPVLEDNRNGKERWNGVDVFDRLESFRKRTS